MTHLEAAFASLTQRAPSLTYAQFAAQVGAMRVVPVDVDAKPAGAVIVHGDEIHACVLPWARGRWLSKRILRVLADVIREHGRAVTRAATSEGVQFVERLGFVRQPDGVFVKAGGCHGN
jgi:hypothetical protein